MEVSVGRSLGGALFLLFVIQFSALAPSCSATRHKHKQNAPVGADTEFIRTSCNATTYPRLCYHSLSTYASKIKTNPRLLAHTALNVSIRATRSTYRLMKRVARIHGLRPREAAAMADCVEVVADSVDELRMSIDELDRVSGSDFWTTMGDIQTWVSAAMTDDDTCMDGFAGRAMNGRVKRIVRKRILKISHLTSNALALVNNYASAREV